MPKDAVVGVHIGDSFAVHHRRARWCRGLHPVLSSAALHVWSLQACWTCPCQHLRCGRSDSLAQFLLDLDYCALQWVENFRDRLDVPSHPAVLAFIRSSSLVRHVCHKFILVSE